jgi:4a-hydroxytetrahydrobiopterin dehydratase
MTELMSDTTRETIIAPLLDNGWSLSDDGSALRKTFMFDTFTRAFGWMTQVAFYAEKWNHHPDWSNSYNRVDVVLTTHDVGGLSSLDAKLARKMDTI